MCISIDLRAAGVYGSGNRNSILIENSVRHCGASALQVIRILVSEHIRAGLCLTAIFAASSQIEQNWCHIEPCFDSSMVKVSQEQNGFPGAINDIIDLDVYYNDVMYRTSTPDPSSLPLSSNPHIPSPPIPHFTRCIWFLVLTHSSYEIHKK